MKVKFWMSKNPISINADAFITEAARLMKENSVRRLPVMDGDNLIGLVTYRNILEAQPSSVSTLSKQEARYLVAKIKVSDIMRKNPISVSPDDDVLVALMEGKAKGLGCYPVVDKGKLVGMITATDLFDLIVHALGAAARDDFIYLDEDTEKLNETSYLNQLHNLLNTEGISLLSFLSFPQKNEDGKSVIFLKLAPGRRDDAAKLLKSSNYSLLN